MVLESLLNERLSKRHPFYVIIVAMLYALFGVGVAMWLFFDMASIVMVLLTVFPSIPLLNELLKREESFLVHHKSLDQYIIRTFLSVFVGFIFGYVLLYLILPEKIVLHLYMYQHQVLSYFDAQTGQIIAESSSFLTILGGNLGVFMIIFLISLLLSFGSMIILAWNASVIATAIGFYVREMIYHNFILGIGIFSMRFMQYVVHGFFEVTGYTFAALSGALISYYITNKDFRKYRANMLLVFIVLCLYGIGCIIFGALVETFITPIIFNLY